MQYALICKSRYIHKYHEGLVFEFSICSLLICKCTYIDKYHQDTTSPLILFVYLMYLVFTDLSVCIQHINTRLLRRSRFSIYICVCVYMYIYIYILYKDLYDEDALYY